VLQHEPGVDEVEGPLLQVVGHDVVPADLQPRPGGPLREELDVQIGADHAAAVTDLVAEPQRDGPGPRPDLEAMGVGGQRKPAEEVSGSAVVDLLEERQAAALLRPVVSEEVRAHGSVVSRPDGRGNQAARQAVSGPSGSLPFGVSMAVLNGSFEP